ncbi:methyltransferase domain-containing protein [Noviherbaspirillum sp. CPCC 100848]|uniref:Methyltransferase domain-containing protein n=1 Tax=Noviherbaspirillum album TaxID=3080276 RepID=A0ABU6JJ71_9BURK|nr:methyltransferase domain-containing protein [Noviherbaspirillum sp. CPCC 100848]MEC4723568.1 methyltransferase domain-containing protein [Noviherbaspirillum sp. CPCC 100848]
MDTKDCIALKSRRRILSLGALGVAGITTGFPSLTQAVTPRQLDVPYEPSPQHVVEKMLELAQTGKNDLLYDLGCGDGRIVITAAQKYGARACGIDLDPKRIVEAKANAAKAGVEDRVIFKVGDLYTSDFSDATVVTLFLWPQVNRKLRPILWQQLPVGTRIVSYIWDMGEVWPPEKTISVNGKKIYYWTITGRQKG